MHTECYVLQVKKTGHEAGKGGINAGFWTEPATVSNSHGTKGTNAPVPATHPSVLIGHIGGVTGEVAHGWKIVRNNFVTAVDLNVTSFAADNLMCVNTGAVDAAWKTPCS